MSIIRRLYTVSCAYRLRMEGVLYKQEEELLTTLNSQLQNLRGYLSVWILDSHMASFKGKVADGLLQEALEACRHEVEKQGLSCLALQQLSAMGELLENKGGVDPAKVPTVLIRRQRYDYYVVG